MDQVVANTLVSAAIYLLVGLGFSIIYTSAGFFHFAHGITLTIGAYATLAFWRWVGAPLAVSACGGILVSAVLGMVMEVVVYRRMRRTEASAPALLLASLGLYVSLQALVTLLFGAGTQSFRQGELPEPVAVFGARVTSPQIGIVVTSLCCWALIWVVLRQTSSGRMLRAVSSDPTLAEAFGISRERVILGAFASGSALAGLGGVLIALDGDMNPTMGFQVLLMGVVAMIVGGVGSPAGLAIGALLIASAEHLGAWYLSSQWQNAIVFTTLILFFLIRPQGFFGKPVRKATV